MDALDLSFSWNHFCSIYDFPPPVLMPWVVGRICNYQGAMILIAPFALSTVWIQMLFQKASWWERLPLTNKHLFQFVGRRVVFKSAEENPPLCVIFLLPLQILVLK